MKKIIFFIFALLVCSLANAQDEKSSSKDETSEKEENTVKPNIIKINPIGLLIRAVNASYEHPVTEKGSVVIGLTYYNWSHLEASDSDNAADGTKGFCGRLEYRHYVSKSKQVLEGLFIGPTIEMGTVTIFYEDDSGFSSTVTKEDSSFVTAIGAKGGYQWVFNGGVTLDLSIGYARYLMNFEEYEKDTDTFLDGSLPSVGFGLGYNF